MADISIAMIVKDEADHLAECVASFAPVAAEWCVVDTGSSDGTLELARRLGCRTEVFPWTNDFAAARNVSLALCRCPWILAVDADERILPEDAPRLLALTEAGVDKCYRFMTRNYTNNASLTDFEASGPDDAVARGFAGWHPSWKVRLFPNLPEAAFVGHVHEMVHESLQQAGIALLTSDIPILHYPLLRPEKRIAAKQELYLALGLEKARRAPDNPRAHAELGAQYAEMGRYAEAVQAYKTAVRLAPGEVDYLAELGGVLHLAGHHGAARTALELAVRTDAACCKAWRNLGVAQAAEGHWDEALRCFDQAHALHPNDADIARCLNTAREQLGK